MFKQLQFFVALVESNSFTLAAHNCGVTQSAISQQIKLLQDNLNVSLLTMQGKSFALTEAGRHFYENGKKILTDLDKLTVQTRKVGTSHTPKLMRIGVLNSLKDRRLELALDKCAKELKLTTKISTASHQDLVKGIDAYRYDLVVLDSQRGDLTGQGIYTVPLFITTLMAYFNTGSATDSLKEGGLDLDSKAFYRMYLCAPKIYAQSERDYYDRLLRPSHSLHTADADKIDGILQKDNTYLLCDLIDPKYDGVTLYNAVPLHRGNRPIQRAFCGCVKNFGRDPKGSIKLSFLSKLERCFEQRYINHRP